MARLVTRAAAVDIGTNTVLLAIAEQSGSEAPTPILEAARITRLGEGVDRARRLKGEARARTLAALAEYAREIRSAGVATEQVAVVGTSALRDADGSEAFLGEVAHLFGVEPRVIDGREEAELTFNGGLSGLDVSGPVVVFDVGGGSTEVVSGELDSSSRRLHSSASLDIGSVRLFERYVRTDPPSDAELSRVRKTIREALATLASPRDATLVGVAGTVMTLAALARGATPPELGALHGAIVTHAEIRACGVKLALLDLDARRAMSGIETGRADVIPVGAVIVDEVLAWAGASSLIASDRGVRWGLLERIFALS